MFKNKSFICNAEELSVLYYWREKGHELDDVEGAVEDEVNGGSICQKNTYEFVAVHEVVSQFIQAEQLLKEAWLASI